MTSGTGPIDPALLDRFAGIVGPAHALRSGADVAPHEREPRGLFPGRTPLVLKPGSVEEVSRILTDVAREELPEGPNGGISVSVRDEDGETILVGSLDFQTEWRT